VFKNTANLFKHLHKQMSGVKLHVTSVQLIQIPLHFVCLQLIIADTTTFIKCRADTNMYHFI